MNKNILAVVLVSSLAMSLPSYASATYTPEQLTQMVSSGNPPKEGAQKKASKAMKFDVCITRLNGVLASSDEFLPSKTLVSTPTLKQVKLWRTDGTQVVECSQMRETLTIISSPYL